MLNENEMLTTTKAVLDDHNKGARIMLYETFVGGHAKPGKYSVFIYKDKNVIGFKELSFAKANQLFWALTAV